MADSIRPTSTVPLAVDDGLRRVIAGRPIAVFTDYDGTLTPIVARPELARIAAPVLAAVERLARLCVVGIISGRDLEDVRSIAPVRNAWFAGSHGMDLMSPDGTRQESPGGRALAPVLAAATDELEGLLAPIEGAWVERKRFASAAHFRQVAEESRAAVGEAVEAVVARHPELRSTGGKCILELRPDIEWDKGRALWWVFGQAGLRRGETVAVFLGDDLTDEDAFAALGDGGVGIVVGDDERPTRADLRARDVDEVLEVLSVLADCAAGDGAPGTA